MTPLSFRYLMKTSLMGGGAVTSTAPAIPSLSGLAMKTTGMFAALVWAMHCAIWSRAKVVTTIASTCRVTYWEQIVFACPRSPFGSWLNTSKPLPCR